MIKSDKAEEKLLLLDVSSLVYRAYHAMPPLTSSAGEPVGALYGLISALIRTINERKPTHIVAAIDLPGKTFRHRTYTAYKATRPPTPDDLLSQLERSQEVFVALGIPVLFAEGFEADDVIASVVDRTRKSRPDLEIEIVSGDADVLQLVDEKTTALAPRRTVSDLGILTSEGVEKKIGLPPNLVTAFKALRGDPSDNIPGVRGIGEKTAVILLRYAGSLNGLFRAAAKPPKDAPKELVRFSDTIRKDIKTIEETERLVTLARNAPIQFELQRATFQGFTEPAFLEMLKRLRFESLLGRILVKKPQRQKEATRSKDHPLTLDVGGGHEDREAFIAAQEAQVYQEIEFAESSGMFSQEIAELERKLIPSISAMERRGIAVDRDEIARLKEHFTQRQGTLAKEITKLAGRPFNLASPKQLSEVLFSDLGIGTGKKTRGGQRSTAAAVLDEIRDAHPIIEKILSWREVTKLLTTYIETFPALIDPKDGRIHAKFWQLGTTTGRIASSEPNLQNIPQRGDDGKAVRNVFRAAKGMVLLAADYSQIELRVAAILADDKEMLDVFHRGEDVHQVTAQRIFHVEASEVTAEMRRRAKVLNFGMLYGMGSRRVSKELGVSFEEGQEFLETYFRTYSGIARWIEQTKEEVRRTGWTITAFGRKRVFPEIRSPQPAVRSQAERAAVNAPIQGTATGDLVKRGMVAVAEYVPEAAMIVQVHDDIVCEVDAGAVHALAPRIRQTLEGVWKEAPIAFPVHMSVGERWGTMRAV